MTRKSFIVPVAFALALVLSGCEKAQVANIATDTITNPKPDWQDTIVISFEFGDKARTRATLEDAKIKDLWLFDYVGGELVQSVHQSSTDAGFGSVSLGVTYGSHTFYAVASGGSEPTTDGTTITWGKPGDTFYLAQTVDLQPAGIKNLQMELKRVATRMRVVVTDEVPADIASIAVSGTWYYALDYLTGEAASAQVATRSVSVPSSYVGTTGQLSVGFYSLCPIAGYSSDITIAARRDDETAIREVAMSGVAFERNRQTVVSGGLSASIRGLSITVDDTWADVLSIEW